MIDDIEPRQLKSKPLGMYLVEAGIVTSDQVDTALKQQQKSGKRLGEILVTRGWVEQKTIDYLMEKVVFPERRVAREKYNDNLTSFGSTISSEQKSYNSSLFYGVPLRKLEVYFFPKRVIQFLLIVVFCLILLNIFAQFSLYYLADFPLRESLIVLFNADFEQNVPAFYSCLTLLVCSILLGIIAYTKKIACERYVNYWRALSIIFLFLSLDESISIHEKFNEPLKEKLQTTGFLYFAWVIPGAIFAFICLLVFLRFLSALPAKTRRLFLIAGTVYVGGALGMELVGASYAYLHFAHLQYKDMTYAIITTIEETLEMLGIIIFIYALLDYIASYLKGVSLRINIIRDKKQR